MRFALTLLIFGFFPIFLLVSFSVKAEPTTQAPVVVELFTSQSCSSCPPADKILGELAERDNVIALSCHVTYWNYLHWEDTLSNAFCTDRQRSYVQAMKKRTSYTPQIVINGRHDVVGNRSWEVNAAVKKSVQKYEVSPISLTYDNGFLEVSLPTLDRDNYRLTLVSYGEAHSQSILSGENRGRTVDYTNPVIQLSDLGQWNGQVKSVRHQVSSSKRHAILVHRGHDHGAIVAAGKI